MPDQPVIVIKTLNAPAGKGIFVTDDVDSAVDQCRDMISAMVQGSSPFVGEFVVLAHTALVDAQRKKLKRERGFIVAILLFLLLMLLPFVAISMRWRINTLEIFLALAALNAMVFYALRRFV